MVEQETVLISLVGHQPLPLLLAIRHIKPHRVIFLYSNEEIVKQRKDNLICLLPPGVVAIDPGTTVDPWYIRSVPERLQVVIEECDLQGADFICDLTGGTKAMAIGLAEFAVKGGYRVIYLESDSGAPLLQYYTVEQGLLRRTVQSELIASELSIEAFLNMYLGRIDLTPSVPKDPNTDGALFENAVRTGFEVLRQHLELDEIKYAIKPMQSEEIDIVLRKGNRLAIVECKQGGEARSAYGILQLNNLASERYLGTYTGKILAVAVNYREVSRNNALMADVHRVCLLQLPNWQKDRAWTDEELQEFRKAVQTVFG